MATSTYNLIASQAVGSGGASSITFSSIPQTYTDLVLKISALQNGTNPVGMLLTFNGSSSSYSNVYLIGSGSGSPSSGGVNQYIGSVFGTGGTANTFNNTEVYIPNYTSSNYKSFSADNVAENNATLGYQNFLANLWSSTAAITSVSISCQSGNFIQYSTAYLYGIRNS